ncbi:MAG TPA: adenylate/guanylate cyclase domain-containing protein [Saprospiraceae bacterium]|nr:adenylate/guanylate cyclase domain-containing protein [Saprospiraceae bacterium]
MKIWFRHLTKRLASIGALPNEDAETRLPKTILVLSSILFMFAGLLWGCMYLYFGELHAGLIPLGYTIFSFFSLIRYEMTRRFEAYRFAQLLLILLLPFFLMVALGGFVEGSAVILWGLISPLGSMIFDDPRKSMRWIFAYLGLVVLSSVLTLAFDITSRLSDAQIQFFFVINFVGVGSLIFMMFYYFVRQKQYFQQRTDELLLNILPKEIAAELKETGVTRAKDFDNVTVMFTDFENFTLIAEKLSAQELVNEIHYCYSAFDQIISAHGLEKIKTIGDSYMCVAGLPVERDTHATDAVMAAMEINAFVDREHQLRRAKGQMSFNIRIGLHSGPVVAGIVGLKKFAYDIWGDTVNTASRLESSGEPGKVNISGSTYELVKDHFVCQYRGKIEAKHKGGIDMYFVEGIKPADV